MLLIEYLNILSRGSWENRIKGSRWGQYFLGAFLGALPGCLGAFTIVSLYTHNMLRFGALVATMIATSGDEAFVMLSLFPSKAVVLILLLFGIAVIGGYLTDVIFSKKSKFQVQLNHKFEVHQNENCHCFSPSQILPQLRNISFVRALVIVMMLIFLWLLILNVMELGEWDWKMITFLGAILFALFVVTTVPDHFLKKHLWDHLIKKHLLRIFLWTFGALILIHYLEIYLDLDQWIKGNYITILIFAVLLGVIPESGPHMIIVTLFASGSIPFSILMASSIVQDGHGMLPLLSVSRSDFIKVKAINMIIGFGIGLVSLLFFP